MAFNDTAIAGAVRTACTQDAEPSSQPPILRDVVVSHAFDRRILAPPQVVLERALAAVKEWCVAVAADDAQVSERFVGAVANQLTRFEMDAKAALLAGCESFFRDASLCFGVEEDVIPELATQFHRLSDTERLGVLISLAESPAFKVLAAAVEQLPANEPFVDPITAGRRLLKATWAAAGCD